MSDDENSNDVEHKHVFFDSISEMSEYLRKRSQECDVEYWPVDWS